MSEPQEAITSAASDERPQLDVVAIPDDFPILRRRIHDRPLAYLDNAATTQKPQSVIDRLVKYYHDENANIRRGVHLLSVESTEAFELARERVRQFLNAAEAREIVFVRGATEAINLVAATYGRAHVGAGRRGRHLGNGSPLQHRAVADALWREERALARRSDYRCR